KATPRRRPRLEALEDRLAPAVVVTGAAAVTSPNTAVLHGTVNPEGATVSARFQYSTDRAFTPTVSSTLGSGFSGPRGVAVDAFGDVFVADTRNGAVKEILPGGTVRTLATGFNKPAGVAVDAFGDV